MTELNLNIKALESLLKAKGDDSSEEDDEPIKNLGAKLGPGSIGSTKKKDSEPPKPSIYEKKKTKDIWDENDVEEGAEYDTSDDPRLQPEYEIIYKQSLSTEEVFLQMGYKNPSSSSCEDMIVKIQLPGVSKIDEIEINVYDKFLDCRTTQYRLGLHLPHPVRSKQASAKWDPHKSTLIVTARMNREFEFLNE